VVSAIGSCPVDPRNAVIMKRIRAEMLEAQKRGDHTRDGQDQQQRARKLTFGLAHYRTGAKW
jgi:hypothetical protein